MVSKRVFFYFLMLTGGCFSEVDLVPKLLGRDLGLLLLTSGCYLAVVKYE
jgi:hypothetical protein